MIEVKKTLLRLAVNVGLVLGEAFNFHNPYYVFHMNACREFIERIVSVLKASDCELPLDPMVEMLACKYVDHLGPPVVNLACTDVVYFKQVECGRQPICDAFVTTPGSVEGLVLI